MSPQPISWPEPKEDSVGPLGSPHSDLAEALQQGVRRGLIPDLALDLALHELVIRAADATGASAAAVALARDGEMVCRATVGDHAPDLGIPLNTRDGLSGACLRTREPQLCLDTQSDPRVDAEAALRLGIRSMLIVPILEETEPIGIIEVFSPEPEAFSPAHDMLLESFARSCARLRRLATQVAADSQPSNELREADHSTLFSSVLPARARSDWWTFILAGLVILSALALSLMIVIRIGWFRASDRRDAAPALTTPSGNSSSAQTQAPPAAEPASAPTTKVPAQSQASTAPNSSALVVYDKGKVVFRVRPTPRAGEQGTTSEEKDGSSETAIAWLASEAAEHRLRSRIEPQYPAAAIANRKSGNVKLEIMVGKDGSVVALRPVEGDPDLAEAASAAVRQWRYEPLSIQGHLAEFQTDVTLKFSLPN